MEEKNSGINLKIEALPTSKSKVKRTAAQSENIIPAHPFRLHISGSSGSGKTNCLLSMLTRKEFYKGYFDIIFIISLTAKKTDDVYDILEKNKGKTKIGFINELDETIIGEIMDISAGIVEDKKAHKAPKVLMVFDDVVSEKKFLNKKEFSKCFIMSRHFNMSSIILSQKYNATPRTCRLNCDAVIYFPGSVSEDMVITDDYCPPGFTKKEFLQILKFATAEPYSFLFINMKCLHKVRYRKNFDTILELQK
ncbi:MAG: hypothetical protein HGN29_18070 [Asgard group archaeon]|nr:hypothetical protein [Asgard group archaeon]